VTPSMGERAYLVLLRVLPRRFRTRHERELIDVYRYRRATATPGALGLLRLWRHLAADAIASAWRERRPPHSGERHTPADRWLRRGAAALRWDLERALGSVWRSRLVSALVVATIALGVGANTLVWSMMEATFLRPPPFAEPERLLWIESFNEREGEPRSSNLLDFADWRAGSESFDGMSALWSTTLTVSSGELPERVGAAFVSASYFDVLGAAPALGRGFLEEEESFGRHRVAVLRHGLWQRLFAGDARVVGRTIRLEGADFTVVGVMPPEFPGPTSTVQVWVPMAFPADNWRAADRGSRWMNGVVARVSSGVTLEDAALELRAVARGLAARYPESNAYVSVRARSWLESEYAETRPALLALGAGVGLLLVLGCVNVASLLLARAAGRRRDLALCAALGATRPRLIRQLLLEASLLGLLGGSLGAGLAALLLRPVAALAATAVPSLQQASIDGSTLVFALGLSLASALLFGVVPAFRTASRLGHPLREAQQGLAAPAQRGLRLLASAEVALAALLLCSALLLGRSFRLLTAVDPGFDPRGVLALDVAVVPADYPSSEAALAFYERLLESLKAVPGVAFAASSPYEQPLGGSGWYVEFGVVGRPVPERHADMPAVRYAQVSPEYFRALGVPILRGRGFAATDRPDSAMVAILNDSAVRLHFGDREPLGERIWLWRPDDTSAEIVGVAGDVRVGSLRDDAPPTVFVPLTQASHGLPREQTVLLRVGGAPDAGALESVAAAALERARALDPRQPVTEAASLDHVLAESLGLERLSAVLAFSFAGVALVLAGFGLYGVVSYVVSGHRRDIGIRLALGARGGEAAREVVGGVLAWVAAGLVVGLGGALLGGRLIASRLFGVAPHDPPTLLIAAAVLALVALLGALLPFRRAARVHPVESLRGA
jgi:putative ABC transport system permease protein